MAQDVKAGTAVPSGAQHAKVFPPFDPSTFAPQLVWLGIAFGLLYLVLSRIALPRIGDVIAERRDRIHRDLASAERLKAETERAIAAYEQAVAEAKAKAGAIAKETRDKLAADTARQRAGVEQEIAGKVAAAERRIAETKAKALASVDAIAEETAAAMVDKLIGAKTGKV